MESEFIYELIAPIKYHSVGEDKDGTFITLYAPSKKQMQHNIILKSGFFRSVASQENNASSEDKISDRPKLVGTELIDMMYSTDTDMHKILLSASELFKSGVAKVEGTEKVTQPILDKLSQDDLEAMTGEYMINFTLASFLKRQGI